MTLNLKRFLEATAPETLEKLAQEAQDELVTKVAEALMPLMEKQAEYCAYLVMQKLAETEANLAEAAAVMAPPADAAPVTGNEDNSQMNPTEGKGLDRNEIVTAVKEALAANQPDKIIPFVQAIAKQNPDLAVEVCKAVKIELHSAVMNKQIEAEKAVETAQKLAEIVGE